jgi:CheY-like chemotaxis protein
LQGIRIILLTSAGRPSDVARCRELGITGYLTKPIKQSELFDAIATAVAGHPREHERYESPGTSIQSSANPLRVLLAEDNPVNQMLATRILEKLGHKVQVVSNGKEATERVRAEEFDLVLMDVQMPEMDGLDATRNIRNLAQATQPHIIAMTANAMEGDREMCLAAGMNDYVSKPIRVNELVDALLKAERKL